MAKKSSAAAKTQPASKRTSKAATTTARPKKHVGDVLGISRARFSADEPRPVSKRGRRPKGVELPGASRSRLKRAGVVGGVRGRGR